MMYEKVDMEVPHLEPRASRQRCEVVLKSSAASLLAWRGQAANSEAHSKDAELSE